MDDKIEFNEAKAQIVNLNKSAAPSAEADEMDSAKMDGLELLDDLIRTFHGQVMKKLDKHFRTGDLIRMIELRYKLSPTNAEQQKFWEMLSKIRRDVLKNTEISDNVRKNGEPQKSATGQIRGGE